MTERMFREPSAAEATDGCTCYRLRRLARRVTQIYDHALEPVGLRVTQFSLLAMLRHTGPVTITELAGATGTDRTTLSRNLKPLQAAGYVDIGPGGDNRSRAVAISDAGREAMVRAVPLWRQTQRQLEASLGPDMARTLHRTLDAVMQRLNAG